MIFTLKNKEIDMEQSEFVKGKWYKNNTTEGTFIFIKYSHKERCNGYNKIWYTEKILKNDTTLEIRDNYLANSDIEKALTEADMLEVSKFLPEGHVDKIENLVGRYVRVSPMLKSAEEIYKFKVGDILKVTKADENGYQEAKSLINSGHYFGLNCIQDGRLELLPIDFNPDKLVGLPEEYIVECKHPQQCTEVRQFYYKDGYVFQFLYSFVVCMGKEMNNNYYEYYIPENFKHLPVFTYEQWTKMKDMKEEFKLPEKWCVKATEDTIEMIGEYWSKNCHVSCYTSSWVKRDYSNGYWYSHNLSSGNPFGVNAGSNHCSKDKRADYTEISIEQFKKYVMKDKKIIGYKLKDINLLKAAAKLTNCPENVLTNNFKTVGYHFNDVYVGLEELKQVKLFDEWLIPVYEEESINLNFGDTRVTVKKGQGYISLQEGSISKTELKQIIDHFSKGPKMLGYEGKADKVIYGCKSGLLSELVKIYETI